MHIRQMHTCWLLLGMCVLIYHNDRLQNEIKIQSYIFGPYKNCKKTGLIKDLLENLNPITGYLDMCRM